MKKLIVVLYLMLLASTLVAQVDNFMVGCYSFMKAYPSYSAFHDSIISYLKNADYNATMYETNDSNVDYTNDLIDRLNAQGIGSYLCDYYWDKDSSTLETTSGSYAISTGNRWEFQAEYDSDNPNYPNADTYFYKFCHSGRTGGYSFDHDRDIWRCNAEGLNADPPGVALHGLRHRWRNSGGMPISKHFLLDSIRPTASDGVSEKI
jgi:hypothetical protein